MMSCTSTTWSKGSVIRFFYSLEKHLLQHLFYSGPTLRKTWPSHTQGGGAVHQQHIMNALWSFFRPHFILCVGILGMWAASDVVEVSVVASCSSSGETVFDDKSGIFSGVLVLIRFPYSHVPVNTTPFHRCYHAVFIGARLWPPNCFLLEQPFYNSIIVMIYRVIFFTDRKVNVNYR